MYARQHAFLEQCFYHTNFSQLRLPKHIPSAQQTLANCWMSLALRGLLYIQPVNLPPEVDADNDGPEPEVSKPVAVKDAKLNFTVVRFLGSSGLVESV